jgi:hypothetical protein
MFRFSVTEDTFDLFFALKVQSLSHILSLPVVDLFYTVGNNPKILDFLLSRCRYMIWSDRNPNRYVKC